ncbi:2Fe-2S iron-sulfur cluster-binding protein [Streptomyces sp. NBC_01803]|nr:2Fe-2S iron-sulfur cluster-binding protein [Streptomyces sp. NBC_01803]WSA44409.1 2Fe-2S iron-sulfur cluster-binding protein [Streptomyces sp. NBC_01803]
MSNEQQPGPDAHGPQPSWGGEYDAEATAFIELPPGYAEESGGEPLAAPGHGYRPPEIGRPAAPPATTEATTDPGATGQWTMPFGWGTPQPEAGGAAPRSPQRPSAAAMGQGAALAGGRRPLGEGPAGSGPAGPAGAEPPQAGHDRAPWSAAGEPVPPSPWSAAPAGEPHPPEPEPEPGPVLAQAAAPVTASAPEIPAPAPVPGAVEPVPVETAGEAAGGAAQGGSRSEHPEVSYVLRVNGVDRPVSGAWIGESLLYVLRERLGLAGAKDGCAQGECGACSVQVDGRLVAACLVPAATSADSEIRTVEGLGGDGTPSDVQRALAASAVQCGFCLPGMAMTVHDLLEGNPAPTELETRRALCGNLCRCSGYRGVLDAVRTVVSERAARNPRAERGERAERAARPAPAPEPAPEPNDPATVAGPAALPAAHEQTARIPHQAGPPPASGRGYPQAGGV